MGVDWEAGDELGCSVVIGTGKGLGGGSGREGLPPTPAAAMVSVDLEVG